MFTYSCDGFFGPDVLNTLRRYFCPYVLYTLRTFAVRTFFRDVLYTLRTFDIRTFVRDVLLSLRTLYPTHICYTYFCPWRTVLTYLIPYAHLLYVLLSVTYFCPYERYTLRTFAKRTFVHGVLLSIRTLYPTYFRPKYICWRVRTYIWHSDISDTNFGPYIVTLARWRQRHDCRGH